MDNHNMAAGLSGPLMRGREQREALLEYMEQPPNRWMLESEAVLKACSSFHPDWKFNPQTRTAANWNHLSELWERWERLEFSPADEEHDFFIRLADAKGFSDWQTFGKDDFRKMALTVSAQLAYYESEQLARALEVSPPDPTEVWKRLYWFTRFFRAMQRIGATVTGSDWKRRETEASKTRAWKRDAWKELLDRRKKNPTVTEANVASDFVKKSGLELAVKTVQDYYTERKKKSVGWGSSDKHG